MALRTFGGHWSSRDRNRPMSRFTLSCGNDVRASTSSSRIRAGTDLPSAASPFFSGPWYRRRNFLSATSSASSSSEAADGAVPSEASEASETSLSSELGGPSLKSSSSSSSSPAPPPASLPASLPAPPPASLPAPPCSCGCGCRGLNQASLSGGGRRARRAPPANAAEAVFICLTRAGRRPVDDAGWRKNTTAATDPQRAPNGRPPRHSRSTSTDIAPHCDSSPSRSVPMGYTISGAASSWRHTIWTTPPAVLPGTPTKASSPMLL